MSAKTLTKKGVVGRRIVVVIKEVVPEQVALVRDNSAVMKNIADATDVSNLHPLRKKIYKSMLSF